MSNIFEITDDLKRLYDWLDDLDSNGEDTTILDDTISYKADELRDKIDGYVYIIRDSKSTISAIDEEIARLQARKKTRENKIKRLENVLQERMDYLEITKIDTLLNSVWVQSAGSRPVIITDEELIPEEYLVKETVVKIDKKSIGKELKALEDGEELPYAKLGDVTRSLRIR